MMEKMEKMGGVTRETIKSEGKPPFTIERREEINLDNLKVISETIRNGELSLVEVRTVISNGSEHAFLAYDKRLIENKIALDPSGLLVDFPATEKKWGTAAGRKPEEFLAEMPGDALGVCPSNWGWQTGTFLVDKGEVITSDVDSELTGTFDGIAKTEKGWASFSLSIENGQVVEADKEKMANLQLGFSMPLVLKDGETINLDEKISDPRFIADLRNVFDFAAGKKLPAEFWIYLKRLLPSDYTAGRRLLNEQAVVIRREGVLDEKEIDDFQKIISENNLDAVLRVEIVRGSPRLSIIGPLPMTRNPVVGIGFNAEGNLMVTTIDGRQRMSGGANILELAEIMKEHGAITAGLGCAGGDVALVLKHENEMKLLNNPSNVDKAGQGITRPSPSLLIIQS